ncbi:MAG: pyrroline-5-carboxylate reductase [Spirochaetaceae bacterium]|nr:pyrroline-5-carboxylate reductase [Spirochaetaceae bacterium]
MSIKVGCIGAGVMGSALMSAVCKQNDVEVFISDADFSKAEQFAGQNGAHAEKTNKTVIQQADYLFFAVKPVYLPAVLEETAALLSKKELLQKGFVSIAAGVKISSIQQKLGEKARIIRVMPNTPAVVKEGMIALAPAETALEADVECVQKLLSFAGSVQVVQEHLMDGITAVSGSGPAYGFMFIDALADAAVTFGMPRKQALTFAAQTLKGAAAMVLETGKHPGILKDEVCSPAGTTIAAVRVLEEKNFRSAIIEAAAAAYEKSLELGKK